MSSEPEAAQPSTRTGEDDFFCEKYEVWYPMRDCNYRVMHATYHGCVECFQGRVNLRRLHPSRTAADGNSARLIRFPTPTVAEDRRVDTPGMAPGER
jgi:hypothetical protein